MGPLYVVDVVIGAYLSIIRRVQGEHYPLWRNVPLIEHFYRVIREFEIRRQQSDNRAAGMICNDNYNIPVSGDTVT